MRPRRTRPFSRADYGPEGGPMPVLEVKCRPSFTYCDLINTRRNVMPESARQGRCKSLLHGRLSGLVRGARRRSLANSRPDEMARVAISVMTEPTQPDVGIEEPESTPS